MPGIIPAPFYVKAILTLTMAFILYIYNVGLLIILAKTGLSLGDNRSCRMIPLILGTMAILPFSDYLCNNVPINILNSATNGAVLLYLPISLYTVKLAKIYKDVQNNLIEPIDVTGPTRLFVVATYLFALAIIVGLLNPIQGRTIVIVALLKCALSLVKFTRNVYWVKRFHDKIF